MQRGTTNVGTLEQRKTSKIIAKSTKKWVPKSSKMTVRRGRGRSGGDLGAMLAPRDAQRPLHVRKAHSRFPLGPPFGRQFSALFVIFRCFFGVVFWRVVLDGFGVRFGVDFGSIFDGFVDACRSDFCGGANLAKCHLDVLFVIQKACRHFQT